MTWLSATAVTEVRINLDGRPPNLYNFMAQQAVTSNINRRLSK
jgi:hypothetical protein